MANTPDLPVSSRTRGGKRMYDNDGVEAEHHKKVKAIVAMLAWFDEEEELDEAEEAAMISQAMKQNIPIPKSYNEAINDPIYAKQWKEAIQYEIGQLLTNNTWKEEVPPQGDDDDDDYFRPVGPPEGYKDVLS
jgi:hypothetical protein